MGKKVSKIYKFERNRKIAQHCPCGKSNSDSKFVPFEGYTKYGYCHSCDRLIAPNNGTLVNYNNPFPKNRTTSYIDQDFLKKSQAQIGNNKFFQFLSAKFGLQHAQRIFVKYKIGTSSRWNGATIFWQIDNNNRIRTGRIMLYNERTGKRIKNCNDWVHSILIRKKHLKEYYLSQCLFGLHLLQVEQYKPSNFNTTKSQKQLQQKIVAIVESEKTACIMSIVLPKYLWMACGGVSSLNHEKIKPLKSSKIILFPDLDKQNERSPFQIWSKKAREFSDLGFDIYVSKLLENNATQEQRHNKLDIGDFFA